MPFISVIAPIYNMQAYLEEFIESVLSQGFDDFELILSDDGSTDSSPEICKKYALKDKRIVFITQKNSGPSAARNAGLSVARGEYLWFADSDDKILPGAFKKLFELKKSGADIINFAYVTFGEGEEKYDKFHFTGEADKSTVSELLKTACSGRMFPFSWRNIYKRDFIVRENIKYVEGLSFAEDSVFNSQAFLTAEKILFDSSSGPLYGYRLRSDGLSKSAQKSFNKKRFENAEIYSKKRDENYEKFALEKHGEYYADAAKFTLETILYQYLLRAIYLSNDKNKLALLKEAAGLECVKKAYQNFDIDSIKSRSLDWRVFKFIEKKNFPAAHLILKNILFKAR